MFSGPGHSARYPVAVRTVTLHDENEQQTVTMVIQAGKAARISWYHRARLQSSGALTRQEALALEKQLLSEGWQRAQRYPLPSR